LFPGIFIGTPTGYPTGKCRGGGGSTICWNPKTASTCFLKDFCRISHRFLCKLFFADVSFHATFLIMQNVSYEITNNRDNPGNRAHYVDSDALRCRLLNLQE
jgi:hypothetical protein